MGTTEYMEVTIEVKPVVFGASLVGALVLTLAVRLLGALTFGFLFGFNPFAIVSAFVFVGSAVFLYMIIPLTSVEERLPSLGPDWREDYR